MKKIRLVFVLLIVFMIAGLTACGSGEETKPADNSGTNQTTDNPGGNTGENPGGNTGENPSGNTGEDNPSGGDNNEEREIASYKSGAITKLDELVYSVIDKIPEESLKAAVQSFYDTEKQYINGINNLEDAKAAGDKVVEDVKTFIKDSLRPLVIEKLNGVINPLIEKITYESLKSSVQEYYAREIALINSLEHLDEFPNAYKNIIDDTKKFIVDETEKILVELKNKALAELDPFVTALINKIPYEELKADTQTFYQEEKKKIDAVEAFDGFAPCVNEIKGDLEAYALSETKKIAVSKLDEVVTAGLAKIPNQELKDDLNGFKDTEVTKLNAVNSIEAVPTTLATVIKETEEHIKTLLVATVKDYVARLTAVEKATAYDYLPEAMCPTYSNNRVDASSVAYDFTSFVNVSSINRAGYGEQWQMVIDNINQSVKLAKVFNAAQTALSSAASAVDIYITNSYANEMSYTFSGDNYTGNFEFKNAVLVFNISLTKTVNVPIAGDVKPIIRMEYDLTKEAKGIYISLGDAYKLKYVIADNRYEMATTYGVTVLGKSGSRSSFLSIEKKDNKTTGHIYEYTTYEGSDKIKACADFYVENGYVSVVGNKASGMIAFDNYINELYLASEGKLLGYEIREEKTIAGVTGTYNTLWFNIWDIKGINTIRVTDKTDANKSSRSTVDVYLNGSTKLLVPTYNTKLGIKTSRKYDVELRTRYYYTYDSANDKYEAIAVEVPMMFVQQGDNYSSFKADVLKDNGIELTVDINSTYLNKIMADYSTLIDLFIVNKENMSSEAIIEYLKEHE